MTYSVTLGHIERQDITFLADFREILQPILASVLCCYHQALQGSPGFPHVLLTPKNEGGFQKCALQGATGTRRQ